MTDLILETFWLYLPAGIANMAPVLVKTVPILDYPMDGGKKWGGKRILGEHKTWRGFAAGVLFAIGAVALQQLFAGTFEAIAPLDYTTVNVWALGFALGFGAMGGDALKSVFKRRRNMKPGTSWIPFDQIDWIVGAVVMSLLVVVLPLEVAITAIILFGLLHPLINIIGYKMGLKRTVL